MSLSQSFKHDAVYTGQQVIDFLNEIEAQYSDKILMIEAQRDAAQGDAIKLRIEYGKALRGAAGLEQKLKLSEEMLETERAALTEISQDFEAVKLSMEAYMSELATVDEEPLQARAGEVYHDELEAAPDGDDCLIC